MPLWLDGVGVYPIRRAPDRAFPVVPYLVDRATAIHRAGGLSYAIKRGIHHETLLPARTKKGGATLFRLTDVDQFIEQFICTGLIDQPEYLLPSERDDARTTRPF